MDVKRGVLTGIIEITIMPSGTGTGTGKTFDPDLVHWARKS